MKLLERLLPSRRTSPAVHTGLWEFRTAREDVSMAFISPDLRTGFGLFIGQPREKRLCRLTLRQLRALLAHDHSQFLRPEPVD